jgi:predicted ABC-type sugar transport system permease subunit
MSTVKDSGAGKSTLTDVGLALAPERTVATYQSVNSSWCGVVTNTTTIIENDCFHLIGIRFPYTVHAFVLLVFAFVSPFHYICSRFTIFALVSLAHLFVE